MGIPGMKAEIHSLNEQIAALKAENERLKKALSDQEKEMDEWVEARDAEIEASFDAGHYRAMSEHATPWKIRAEAAERALAERAGGVKVPLAVRQAADFTRKDLGADGTNYPHVRAMLAFIEALTTEPAAPEGEPEAMASIVPEHCTGSSLVFSEGILHVNKDGSGHIVIKETDFQIETEYDDDGARSDFWITRLPSGEMQSLRDFLNGVTLTRPAEQAATEAKVEVVAQEIANAHKLHGRNFTAMARAALKAAMEAGR